MHKKVIISLLLSFYLLSAQAQSFLADANVELYPHFGEAKNSFQQLIKSYSRENIEPLNRLKEIFSQPSISGTLYYNNGSYYVVSSAFPLYYADRVDVVLVVNGKRERYDQRPIAALDKNSNLALISLGPLPLALKMIDFNVNELVMGQSVALYRAGGEDGQQGVISSPSRRFPYLSQGNLIEHSLTINYQQSGSPLVLITNEGEHRFIGMNLYGDKNPDYTGYTVPATTVARFISRYNEQQNSDQEAILIEQAKALIVELNQKNSTKSANYLALSLSERWANQTLALNMATSSSSYAVWHEKLMLLDSDQLYKELMAQLLFRSDAYEFRSIVAMSSNPTKEPSTVAYYLGDQIIITSWLKIFGQWQLIALPNNFIDESQFKVELPPGTTSGAEEKLSYSGLFVGAGSLVGDYKPFTFQVGYDLAPIRFISFNFMLAYESMGYHINNDFFTAKLLTPSVGIRLQAPIKTKVIQIVPFVGLHAGMPITLSHTFTDEAYYNEMLMVKSRLSMNLGWNAGLELGIGAKPFIYLGFEMGYNQDFFTTRYFNANGGVAQNYYGRGFMKFVF